MKVFLSHSTKDKVFVQKLARELEAKEIDSWLCEVDVLIGDDFVEEIERGLKETDLTLLIWSPSAASSAWTGKEWRSVLARETEEAKKRLGIVLLHDAELPQLLRTKNYVDARNDPAKAIKETVEWLIRQRDMRRYEHEEAARFMVDYKPSDFVGRAAYFEELHKALVDEQGKYLLWGGPGSGKSTLALKFAWNAQGAFDTVIFQHCGQRTKEEIGVELAERIGLDIKELPPERQITEAKQWLCQRKTLLVLDDIWHLDVKDLIPGPPLSVASLSILCTSRQRSLPWVKRPRTKEVTSFLDEETEALFRLWLEDETVSRHRDNLLALAERVEHLPIAVAVAAEMLSRQFGPLDKEATALELERLRNGIHDVPDLLQRAIESQSEPNQRLLQAMAVCHPEGFWFPLAAMTAGFENTDSRKARDHLVNSSLVQVLDQGRQRFRLHALLREQLLQSYKADELNYRHLQVLEDLFNDWEVRWKECCECLTEVIPALNILHASKSMDRIARLASSGFALGERVGKLQIAFKILRKEEQILKDGETTQPYFSIGQSYNYGNQAVILKAWGRLKEAMVLFRKQEALSELLGDKDSLGMSYNNQALILRAWGRLQEAMTLHKKEEALCEKLGNKDGLQRSYGNQALILVDWGQLEEALALLEKQEALCKELGNKGGLQRSYGNQARILVDWGQLQEAMTLHKKEEALCEELGNKDGLQRSYGNQALILVDWGQLQEAMTLHKKEEALCEELGSKDGLQRSYGNQALILRAWGQLQEAMTLHKKKEALCEELGKKSSLGYCYWNWGLLARELNEREMEQEKLKAALQIFTSLHMPRERDAVKEALENME